MDTRSKIVPLHELNERLKNQTAQWISGYFDPLLSGHVELLRQARRPGSLLVVEITNPERPLLSQRARAELVAALAAVDFVVLQNGGPPHAPALDPHLTERFMEHVIERHRPADGPGQTAAEECRK